MKIGQHVIACVKFAEESNIPLAQDQYRKGVVKSERPTPAGPLYTVAFGEPHQFNYEELEFVAEALTRFEPMDDEQAAAIHAIQLKLAFAAIEAALANLLPGETVEIKEGSIVGYHGGVTLDPVTHETKRIGCIQETAAWQVTKWQQYGPTRWNPAEIVDAPVGTFAYSQAVQKFVETIFALKAADYWQHKADEAMAQAWQEGEL